MRKLNFLLYLLCFWALTACKPDSTIINIYTTDDEEALSGKMVAVPITMNFTLFGDDDGSTIDQAVKVTKSFVHPDSTFTRSTTDFGENLVVETFVPLVSSDASAEYLKKTNAPVVWEMPD